ncbi:MAG: hypothetical protein NTW10_00685 [Bacteroidetes bacterium]|nr:hypothetical protein [Bacteroidota bacterium]
MHLLAISLLSILAGTLLLVKFKKEPHGKFFAFISWFFIVVGFLLFLVCIAGGICKMKHHCSGDQPGCPHEMMMKECTHGGHAGFCSPEGMGKGMCPKQPGCMQHDSAMKCCPKQMKCDSTKCQHPK